MKLLPLIAALAFLIGIFFLCKSPSDAGPSGEPEVKIQDAKTELVTEPELEAETTDHYVFKKATRDGTGKFYLGREIAQVMGHPAISWLERNNREDEEAPTKAIEILALKEDAVIADIGAGSGYYTFRLAQQHPKGHVIAVDIQPEMISYLELEKNQLKAENVSIHLGKIDDTLLEANSIDAAIMVDAYHEFSHPYEMIRSLAKALRPGGRLFLLEYREEDPLVPIKLLHKMSQKQAKAEMSTAGLKWVETKHDLPWQHLLIFKKTTPEPSR
ncbi:class I SAM-dependent methyltransferase [Akkermansiaceae bacterium]|nr:class I SAM-dependent methyltransferase [Akkermansiaceae bacterium]